jgi:hypothetical protein
MTLFVSGRVQYNVTRHSVSTNARFRWEYTAGSELFVVYNDNRHTLPSGCPDPQDRFADYQGRPAVPLLIAGNPALNQFGDGGKLVLTVSSSNPSSSFPSVPD